jgi:uncharacterized membrane protein YfcA
VDLATVQLIAVLVLVGGLAGVMGGMLGIGGGLVMIPTLVLLRQAVDGPKALHLYSLAAISASVVVVLPAALRHMRLGAVRPAMMIRMAPFAIVGVLLGAWATDLLADSGARILRRVLGATILAAIGGQIAQARREHRDAEAAKAALAAGMPPTVRPPERSWVEAAIVGGPGGFLSGLLGIGGGVWAVPVQQFGFNRPLRESIAVSTMLIAFTAPIAAVMQGVLVAQHPSLSVWRGLGFAACLAPGAVLGGWIGAGLTHRLPIAWVRATFCVLLGIAGVRLLTG